jgi:ABC-type lipopolysaccharide export system ATPase subunit
MPSITQKLPLLAALLLMWPACFAGEKPIEVPAYKNESLITQYRNMTVEAVFAALMSDDVAQRRLAQMYVVGVVDSSEGEVWCNFKTISPSTIDEQVHIGLKVALEKTPKARAATVIEAHLKAWIPCRKRP